ncbi:MAG TPA: xanthine dehydrogenase accessory protein XdhC [Rhizobium sp.]|nr:xanthine dehydrogenase accessory protein XdhC [Rhizobium sp.]
MISPTLPDFVAGHPELVLVEVREAKGSTPREAGAYMLVAPRTSWGTIGGGQMELLAIERARTMLAAGETEGEIDLPLGPEIGQCCGGRVVIDLKRLGDEERRQLLAREDLARRDLPQVFVFGAGHVGLALAAALAPLPVATTVVETRSDTIENLPHGVAGRLAALPEALVAEIAPGGAAVILTHDHALDFLIAREALARGDLAYVGMIGSATKRATFESAMRREGFASERFARLVLPIGGDAVRDKRPAVIAAMVAAELMAVLLGK